MPALHLVHVTNKNKYEVKLQTNLTNLSKNKHSDTIHSLNKGHITQSVDNIQSPSCSGRYGKLFKSLKRGIFYFELHWRCFCQMIRKCTGST